MSYIRRCNICGQRISMREMPAGQWVAFDPSTDHPHEHYDEPSESARHRGVILDPILAETPSSVKTPPASIGTGWQNETTTLAALPLEELLSVAKNARQILNITYLSQQREVTRREIEVIDVDEVYCYAYCRLRQDLRHFRLDRIQSASLKAESFQPRDLTRGSFLPSPGLGSAFPRPTGASYGWIWWIVALLILWLLLRH